MQRVGILGFGFSGNLTLAHLVRGREPREIYVIDPLLDGRGIAYRTPYDAHLLNVRAGNMSAFPDAPEDFLRWLHSQQLGYQATDFVPRRIYGDYLDHVWQQSQSLAAQHGHRIRLVPSEAVAIDAQLNVTTARGDAIALEALILATGNEFLLKPSPIAAPMLQDPWQQGALAQAATSVGPILLFGSGLTAVDMVLALRAEGFSGPIAMHSRHHLLPRPHRDGVVAQAVPFDTLPQTLAGWRSWRKNTARGAADWRHAIDGLRPHTQLAWQRLSTKEKSRFFRRLASFWNVHRHRMAPQIAQRIEAEIAAGQLTFGRRSDAVLAINCTGPELRPEKSARPLIKSLLSEGLIEPHATSIGIAVDSQCRAWGRAYPKLFTIGSPMTGQLLESTAVPELRVQAQTIAEALCKSLSNK